MAATVCVICKARKSRRTCPVEGEICSQCCGNGREETIDCPINCPFLIEGRIHAKTGAMDTSLYPGLNPTDDFVSKNHSLITITALALIGAAVETEGCADQDLQDCLDASIQRHKSLDSGLIYEARPDNRVAAEILDKFEPRIEDFRQDAVKRGFPPIKEADLLRTLVFHRLLAGAHNNGRRKSRAYIHFLYGVVAQQMPPEAEEPASLIS